MAGLRSLVCELRTAAYEARTNREACPDLQTVVQMPGGVHLVFRVGPIRNFYRVDLRSFASSSGCMSSRGERSSSRDRDVRATPDVP